MLIFFYRLFDFKHFSYLSGLAISLVILLLAMGCSPLSKELVDSQSGGSVQVSFQFSQGPSAGSMFKTSTVDTPTGIPTTLYIVISQNKRIIFDQTYPVSKIGTLFYATLPTLQQGDYSIIKCQILNDSNTVIYEAPTNNIYAQSALPQSISVKQGKVTSINIVMLPVVASTSNQMLDFSIGVMDTSGSYTNATVQIMDGSSIVYSGNLSKNYQHLSIPNNGYDHNYTITVSKNYLIPIVRTFKTQALAQQRLTFQFIDFKHSPSNKVLFGIFREANLDPTQLTSLISDFASTMAYQPRSAMMYVDWSHPFPQTTALAAVQSGAAPHIVWEPWISGTGVSLDGILAGQQDAYIQSWASAAALFKYPIFIRLMHEFNTTTYPWGYSVNGNTPDKYRQVFQYIVNKFNSNGATNVIWVWSPDINSWDFTSIQAAYPGNSYVDWIGLDGYDWTGTSSFYSLFNQSVSALATAYPTKPIMIAEFADASDAGEAAKTSWISAIPNTLSANFPSVKAIFWFDLNKERDWRTTSSTQVSAAFKSMLLSSIFQF